MAWLNDLQRTSVIAFSLGALLVAACSDSEERPPLVPDLEDGTEVYVAPNTPANNPDPAGTGGTQYEGGGGDGNLDGYGGSGTGGTGAGGFGGSGTGGSIDLNAGGTGALGGTGGDGGTAGVGGVGGVGGAQ